MTDHCVHHRMSAAIDGELSPEEVRAFRAHLATCDRCAAAFAELEAGVGALRSRGSEPLPAAAVAAIVDRAMPAPAAAPRGPRPVLLVTHAAALAAGLALAWWSGGRAEAPAPEVREVRVEVPVEVPVEVVREVEVPVEVVVTERVEVPVERIVEVERVVREEVERPVAHPLQGRWDQGLALARSTADLAALGARALELALVSGAARVAAAPAVTPGASPPVGAVVADSGGPSGPTAAAPAAVDEKRFDSAALVVRREGARVRLVTRGSVDEVVPALIDALDAGDPAVAAAALDRLEVLRADLEDVGDGGSDGRARLASFSEPEPRPVDRAGGIRGLLGASRERAAAARGARSSSEKWRAWWNGRAD